MTTDYGWLLKGEKAEEYVKLTGTEEFFDLKPDPDGIMYQTITVADRLQSSYDRSYIKIQESLAQAQGLITTVMIVLILCLAPYSRLKFYEALMNEIFHFNLSKSSRTVRSNKPKMNTLQKEVTNSNSDRSPGVYQDNKDYKDNTMNMFTNKT